jgi:pimeloyl-ACP methyl ester carboxylesterase
VYAPQLSQPGLFLAQLSNRSHQLPALNTPLLGDSLLRPTGEPWLNALMFEAPKLDINKPEQIAALPLGSQLKIDAWDDKVIRLNTRSAPILYARNKMPFEVAYIHSRLTRYEPNAPESASLESEQGGVDSERQGQTSDSGPSTSGKSAPAFEKRLVHIFFATDRARGSNLNGIQEFTGARAPDDAFVFGSADVSIPPGHTIGVIESPSWIHLRIRFDKDKDIMVTNVSQLPSGEFLTSLDQQIRSDPKRQALVFVHGYNVTFDDAVRRLAQITYDLGFPGASILYSWPSKGSLLSYAEDEGNAEWSSPHFLSFLEMLERDKQVDTIHIIAHSMGSRLVTSALETLSERGQQSDSRLGTVIMAAPDVDVGVFSRFANPIHRLVSRIAIYDSSRDAALMF